MEAFFMPAAAGQRFCLYHPPADGLPERGGVVFVHPFAEEMNKCRRMAALQSRALAAAGYAVLQMDLLGCGDSSGDFGDATWEAWVEDVGLACTWLQRHCAAPRWLWGLRGGCLLAAAAAREMGGKANFLFWQPVVSGKLLLRQFLRLKTAGALVHGDGKETVSGLRERLAAGDGVEVAGYLLAPALAQGLDAAELAPPPAAGRVEWLEVAAQPEAGLAPAAQKCLEDWRAADCPARSRLVAGEPFWQTVETSDCPALVAATLAALEDGSGG